MSKLNEIVWCIKDNIEVEGYGDYTPKRPWQGKITKDKGDIFWVSRMDKNGESDEDTNATALCISRDLFETEKQAQEAYIKAVKAEVEDLHEQISHWRIELDYLPKL